MAPGQGTVIGRRGVRPVSKRCVTYPIHANTVWCVSVCSQMRACDLYAKTNLHELLRAELTSIFSTSCFSLPSSLFFFWFVIPSLQRNVMYCKHVYGSEPAPIQSHRAKGRSVRARTTRRRNGLQPATTVAKIRLPPLAPIGIQGLK